MKNLVLENATLDKDFVPGKDYYLATAEVGKDYVYIIPTALDNHKITVCGDEVKSNSKIKVELRNDSGYGYTTIEIVISNEDNSLNEKCIVAILKPAPDKNTLRTIGNRPQFHFTAPYGFANDPNGMMYNAVTDKYHFFYQAYPYAAKYGKKHWAHFSTSNLVNFEEKEIALFPDSTNGEMWSGSGVIDYKNVAGLYSEDSNPAERMLLIYYGYKPEATCAGIAYTTDGGETWKKACDSDGIPIKMKFDVEPGHIDPKVIWYEKGNTWLMFTANGRVYTSDDLWNWKYNSWDIALECPDIYQINIEGSNEIKWVRNVGGTIYLVGEIVLEDGAYKFREECKGLYNGDSHEKNDNPDFPEWIAGEMGVVYAAQHFAEAPNGRIVSISWLREQYTKCIDETKTWCGIMTVPMEQKLYKKEDGSYILYSFPVEELKGLRKDSIYSCKNIIVTPDSENILKGKEIVFADFDGVFSLDKDVEEFGFKLRQGSDDGDITIKYDVKNELLTGCYENSKDDTYRFNRTMKMKLPEDRKIFLRILLDSIVVEAFGNNGEAAISSVYYRGPYDNSESEFYTIGGNITINELNIYSMNSFWKD